MIRPLTALSFVFILSCTQPQVNTPKTSISATQSYLSDFSREYANAYNKASNDITRNEVREDYRQRLNSYIVGTKKYVLDSVRVTVDRIDAATPELVFTEFTGAGVSFHHAVKKQDAGFAIIKGLQEGKDTLIDLFYLGEIELSEPDSYQPIKIKAAPTLIK